MASVRVEGFPSPDAKTTMEAMVDDESERSVDVSLGCLQVYLRTQRRLSPMVHLSEDERQNRGIAVGAKQLVVKEKTTSKELVGEIQLADDDE